MTDQERDNILLEILTRLGGVETYVRAMAGKLLSPIEIAEVEEQVRGERVTQPP